MFTEKNKIFSIGETLETDFRSMTLTRISPPLAPESLTSGSAGNVDPTLFQTLERSLPHAPGLGSLALSWQRVSFV